MAKWQEQLKIKGFSVDEDVELYHTAGRDAKWLSYSGKVWPFLTKFDTPAMCSIQPFHS